MPVPKKRTSHSKRNMRRSHHKVARTFGTVCPNCGEATLRHRVCPSCGQYRGRQVAEASSEK